MTIAELIAQLQQFDPALRVLTDGYEGGYCELFPPELAGFKQSQSKSQYTGPFERTETPENQEFQAVLLGRMG
jgi:hypothetical protein